MKAVNADSTSGFHFKLNIPFQFNRIHNPSYAVEYLRSGCVCREVQRSYLRHKTRWTEVIVAFLSPSKQMPGWYLKLHKCSLPFPFACNSAVSNLKLDEVNWNQQDTKLSPLQVFQGRFVVSTGSVTDFSKDLKANIFSFEPRNLSFAIF